MFIYALLLLFENDKKRMLSAHITNSRFVVELFIIVNRRRNVVSFFRDMVDDNMAATLLAFDKQLLITYAPEYNGCG